MPRFPGGGTEHGDGNYAGNVMLNIPIVGDKLAIRGVVYYDRRGGYIDNVPSTFTRKPTDYGPASYGTVYPPNVSGANNYAIAAKAEPDHLRGRAGFRPPEYR